MTGDATAFGGMSMFYGDYFTAISWDAMGMEPVR